MPRSYRIWKTYNQIYQNATTPGFYPSTFLQLVNGSKNSILNWVLKLNLFKSLQVFFLHVCQQKPKRFFIILHHWFKHQVLTEQTDLTNQFIIQWKYLCSCVQKIKNKHDSGGNVVFLFLRVTHSLVERLTVFLGNRGKTLRTKKWNS